MARLGDLTNIKTGKLDANAASPDGQYPFFTCSKEPLRITTYQYDCECVLVAGNGDLNVKYYHGKFDAYQRTYIIESKDKSVLLVPYLYCFLDGYVETLREQSIGGVIKYIKLGNLTEARIPLPDLDTQNKIVNCLGKLEHLISLRKQQLAKLDEAVKSKFIEMIEDVVKQERLLDHVDVLYGFPFNSKLFNANGQGIPLIRIRDINTGFSGTYTTEEADERYFINNGDCVVGMDGNFEIVKWAHGKAYLNQRVCKFTPRDIKREYMIHYLYFALKEVEKVANSTTVKHLSAKDIGKMMLPVVTLEKQAQFEELSLQSDKHRFAIQQSLNQLEILKKSLMQQYFG